MAVFPIKFGRVPLVLAVKNQELRPLETIWKRLSQQYKSELIAQRGFGKTGSK